MLEAARDAAVRRGLAFNVCREEFTDLNTPGAYCDGQHMLQ